CLNQLVGSGAGGRMVPQVKKRPCENLAIGTVVCAKRGIAWVGQQGGLVLGDGLLEQLTSRGKFCRPAEGLRHAAAADQKRHVAQALGQVMMVAGYGGEVGCQLRPDLESLAVGG